MLDHDVRGGATEIAPPDGTRLATRIAELPDLPVAVVKEAWTASWGAPPPKGARRRFLVLGITWKWQTQVHGGFPPRIARRLARLETTFRQDRRIDPGSVQTRPRLMPGTRIVRDWRGERHEVHVTESGYIWQGQTHASLSAIARTITGTRRNGPAFFGLRNGEGVR